jgi:glycosyltransferase involved in cell wall biosynthesis
MTGTVVQINTMPGWYGGEYQVFELVRGLASRGCDTVLLARGDGQLFVRAMRAGLPVLPIPPVLCRRGVPFGGTIVRRLLRGRSPVLYHAHDSRALQIAPGRAGHRDVPVVLSRRVPSPFRGGPVARRRYSPDRVARIIAVSAYVRDVLVRSGVPASQVVVVASGTDEGRVATAEPMPLLVERAGGRFRIGGVGELTHKKNWAMLVHTAAELKRRGLDLAWFIAGDGPERGPLVSLARELGVDDAVSLLGFVDDIEAFVKGLDVLLHASRAEGTPGAVRMAMLAGVPVVAAATGGTIETLAGHGLTMALDDVHGAADAIERLVKDAELRAALADAARTHARAQFGIDVMVDRTLGVYRDVLRGAA